MIVTMDRKESKIAQCQTFFLKAFFWGKERLGQYHDSLYTLTSMSHRCRVLRGTDCWPSWAPSLLPTGGNTNLDLPPERHKNSGPRPWRQRRKPPSRKNPSCWKGREMGDSLGSSGKNSSVGEGTLAKTSLGRSSFAKACATSARSLLQETGQLKIWTTWNVVESCNK